MNAWSVGMGLEMVEIIMEVEQHFRVSLPDDRVGECRTFGDLVDAVTEVVAEASPHGDTAQVDAHLRDLLVNGYQIKPEHITRDAELYGRKLSLG